MHLPRTSADPARSPDARVFETIVRESRISSIPRPSGGHPRRRWPTRRVLGAGDIRV